MRPHIAKAKPAGAIETANSSEIYLFDFPPNLFAPANPFTIIAKV